MKKIFTIILLILAIILGGTWGIVASYADEVEIDDPIVKLVPIEGSAFYAVSGNDWQALIDEVVIEQGTAVKTEADSKAKVVFYDTQELVLDEKTEIIINQAFIDDNAPLYTKVKATLEKGQIWARLLELMNPDAAFEVESANVVATVRGTSFNMKADDDIESVSVFENKVEVYSKSDPSFKQMVLVDEIVELKDFDAKKLVLRKMKQSDKQSDWIESNLKENSTYKQEIKKRFDNKIKKSGPLPGENGYALKSFAEKIKMAATFDEDKRNELAKSYKIKRALEAQALIKQKKFEEARDLIEKEGLQKTQMDKMVRLRSSDPELLQKLKKDTRFRDHFLKHVNSREKEFILNKLRELIRFEGESADVLKDNETDQEDLLKSELKDDFEQIVSTKDNIPESIDEPIIKDEPKDDSTTDSSSNSSTSSGGTTNSSSTTTQNPNNTRTNTTSPNNVIIKENFEVAASRTNLIPGGQSTLSSALKYSDGRSIDTTQQTRWTLAPDDLTGKYAGTLNGNVFSANKNGGKAYITGHYYSNAKNYQDTIVITVLVINP